MDNKKTIRKSVKEQKAKLSFDDVKDMSNAIFAKVIATNEFKIAKNILIYVSYNTEVETFELITYALKEGKNVFVPKIIEDEMVFIKINSLNELEKGKYGILEPLSNEFEYISDGLMIMPGIAFDLKMHRIGYGGGYYDRYLAKKNNLYKIALAYDFQVFDSIPYDEYDIKPDMIITNEMEIKMTDLELMGKNACAAATTLNKLNVSKKNELLMAVATALELRKYDIINANKIDIDNAIANNMAQGLVDRLALNEARIKGMIEGIMQVVDLDDPVGEVISMKKRPNGLMVGQKRVPIGVIAIIYESRPNVTVDAFALCFKTGNAVILKGGSDAINSNICIVNIIREVLESLGYDKNAIQLIEDTNRETVNRLMKLNKYIDVIIPRGGAKLIKNIVENSTIPVIETGTGNCHIYVDEYADLDMAANIIYNAKTQRIGVCNACESVVVHKKVADTFIPMLVNVLKDKNVEIRGDKTAMAIDTSIIEASEEDFYTEYLDYIMSLKVVSDIDEAIAHINEHNTKHSEAIITKDYDNSNKFLDEIDAACVYVNASTRFTDGFEFGFGAEIGISTQKLHARGPMGLKELTTTKYIIYGNGQVRP